MRRALVTVVVVFAAASCILVTDKYANGAPCSKDADCPATGGYFCVSTASWPQARCGASEKDCSCEVPFPPLPFGTMDAGVPDAGPAPDYCADIKPILNTSCIFTCHGAQMGYPNSPATFRLDYWATPVLDDGGMGVPGVQSQLDRIDDRVYFRLDMPPNDFQGASMTTEQRALIHKWYHTYGAPLGDGGCEHDAGTPDAGTVISFATDIIPIFTTSCTSCHGANTPSAGLSLTAANAYNQLVNKPTSAGCNMGNSKRVVPNMVGSSMLWLKLSNNPAKCNAFEPNGAAMPFNASNPTEFSKIEQWITQGAANN